MDDGNDPEWFFIRCVGDQILANANEAQRAGRKVRACVAALGKCDQVSFSINSWTDPACSFFGVYDFIEKQFFQLNRGLFI